MLLSNKRLIGLQTKQLRKALEEAFDQTTLKTMMQDDLDIRIMLPQGRVDWPAIVDDAIEQAEQQSKTAELLQAALAKRPGDQQLFLFAQQFGLVPDFSLIQQFNLSSETTPQLAFQHAVREWNLPFDIDTWLVKLQIITRQVCRIENRAGTLLGTGFLMMAPDIVMTNHHVLVEAETSQNLICRFDYKIMSDGTSSQSSLKFMVC